MKKKFVSPLEAETHYFSIAQPKVISTSTQTELSLEVLSDQFSRYCKEKYYLDADDFLLYVAPAMHRLNVAGRSNVLYDLAKGIAVLRNDGSESLFPVKRMPIWVYCSICLVSSFHLIHGM